MFARSKFVGVMSLFLFLTVTGRSAAVGSADHPGYKPESVCDVLASSNRMSGELVEIEAEAHNAVPHGLVLVDQRCPKKSLQLDYELKDADISLLEFHRLIINDAPEVRGRLRGTVKRDSATGHLYLLLRLFSTWNL